jgi:hypothetical protein
MIRSNLHGAESPTNGCCDPTRGKEKPEASTKKKEGHCIKDTPAELDPGGFAFPPRRSPWRAHDIIILTLTSPRVRVCTYDGQLCANWHVWQHSRSLEAKRLALEA